MPLRILITGDRHWYCESIAQRVLTGIIAKSGRDIVIVHGDATGVDRAFRNVAEAMGVAHEPHPAKWDDVSHPSASEQHHWTGRAYDLNAGPRRNSEMINLGAAYAIVVHRSLSRSRGTADCARKCLRANIDAWLIDGEGGKARRLAEDDLKVKREGI